MALNNFPHPTLETKLTVLTGVIFFVPLLFASIYINSIIRHEHNAIYVERADKAVRDLAPSPLTDKLCAAIAQGTDPTRELEALYAAARSLAANIRYVALIDSRGNWFFYPPQAEHIRDQAKLRAVDDWMPSSMSDKVATGLFQTGLLPIGDGESGFFISLGYTAGDMEDLISQITLPLQEMMLAFMLLGLLLAAFLAQSIKKILLGLEPEAIATLLQERNAMLGLMTEGVIAIDAEERITLVNEEACRILALAGTDSSPKSLALAQTPLVQHLRLVSADGQASQNVEQDLNGVTVLANYKPVYVEGRIVGAIVTFKDMSELRQLAERITDINRYVDALRSQSHEFMNKLHVIMGLVNNGRFGEVGNYIKELVDSGTAEGRIIHDAVKDPLIAGFLASKYSHAREMGVSLRFEMHGILPPLENAALRNGLVTILGNLIDNALDAVQKMPKRAVKVSLDVCENELTLAVADTGSGIAEAEQQTIFSKSYSSKGPHRGLGLWLVSKSITALGGCIELESQKGEGVIFTVRLPLQPREKPC